MLVTRLVTRLNAGGKNNVNSAKAGAFFFGRGAFPGSGIRSFAWALPIIRTNLIDGLVVAVTCSSYLPKAGSEEKWKEQVPCAARGVGEPLEWGSSSWLTSHKPQWWRIWEWRDLQAAAWS